MKSAICLICCTLAVIGAVHAQPDLSSEALPGQETCTDLNGSWEMISMTVTTPDSVYTQDESEVPTLKILNDTHWMFIRQSAQEFVFAQGGTYRLEDGVYTEIVGYRLSSLSVQPAGSANLWPAVCWRTESTSASLHATPTVPKNAWGTCLNL